MDAATGAVLATHELTGAATSLAVADGTAYLVRASLTAPQNDLLALDVASCATGTCTTQWSASLGAGGASVVSGGGVVYAGTGDGTVAAFDAAGCGAATCSPIAEVTVPGPVGGMIVSGGRLYVNAYSEIHAFEPA
jgi:outer membrane protein assembly factor BamB